MPDIDMNLANPPLAPSPYVRLGAGSDWPKTNGFIDNNCSSRQLLSMQLPAIASTAGYTPKP